MRLPNNYGGVVFLGKKRRRPYAARITTGWTKDNKQIYKYLGYFEKRIDALQCLVEYNQNPYNLDAKKITFAEVYEKWSDRHFVNLTTNTKKSYTSAFKLCTPLYKVPFADLKANNLQFIIDENKDNATVHVTKSLFNQLCLFAIKNEIVEKNYSDFIEMPTKKIKKKRVPFTAGEIALLWENQNEKCAEMVLVLLYTGMRISELLDLTPADVNIAERYIIGGTKTDAGRDRTIPIHKKILPIIEKKLSDEYVFSNKRGKKLKYQNTYKDIMTLFERLELEHTIHETRHTFISQCSRLDLDNLTVKKIVGHATKDVTDRYTHKDVADFIKVIDGFYY